MAIIKVKELMAGRDGGDDREGNRQYRRVFQVKTDNVHEGARTVLASPDLPRPYATYRTSGDAEIDLSAVCVRRKATQNRRNAYLWEVVCEYANLTREEEDDPDPLRRPPSVSFGFRKYTTVADENPPLPDKPAPPAGNLLANAFTNSATEIFDPQPTIERSLPVLTVGRYEQILYPLKMIAFTDAVNLQPFLGGPPGTVLCEGIDASLRYETDPVTEQLVDYWYHTYVFVFHPQTWQMFMLDAGNYYEDPELGRVEFTTDDNAGIPAQPRKGLLNGQGGALPKGDTPIFLAKRVRAELDFSLLGIEQTIRSVDSGDWL